MWTGLEVFHIQKDNRINSVLNQFENYFANLELTSLQYSYVMHDLVSLVQFEKHEKYSWRSVLGK